MALPDFNNLGDLIRRDRDPRKTAVIDLGGETAPREYSYADLDAMANAVARGLVRRGLKRGERVAILAANRMENLAAYFGIMRAGMVAVPVNFKFPPAMVEFVLTDADARLVFCDHGRKNAVPNAIPAVTFSEAGAEGFDAFVDPGPFSVVVPRQDEVAMFLYTSGSTGKPKGVMLSHQSHIWVAKTRLGDNDWSAHRFLIAAPLYHMNALALAKLACVAHSTIVLLPQFNASAYIKAIADYRCTWLTAVPPMVAMMLQEKSLLQQTDLSSVEFLRMGSAPVSPSLMAATHAALPHAKVTNAFGTTEGGPVVFGPHPENMVQPEMSVGYPHPAVSLRLVDGDELNAEQGVLQMKSPAVMLGYHKGGQRSPPLTAPFTQDGFYITGDVFRRDAHGFHFFVGRIDDMFVSGGENIYPGEVEKLLESHPAVMQAAVVPVEDEIKGQKPAAFVIKRPGSAVSAEELKAHALANGPAYQHPRWIWFVDALPLASTNKIDRGSLVSAARARVAGPNA
jgi:acyl-CoA synthetase (AMP-forming)/AMP-acid ligase II